MKRARFTEEQIIAVLKEHEAGAKTADLARKHRISEATIYSWKVKFGGIRGQAVEGAGGGEWELKKLLAEQMLDAPALSRAPFKNGRAPPPSALRSRICRLS